MIETLKGFPDNVIAVSAKGHVTKGDYRRVIAPKLKAASRRHRKIRCYYELGPEFSSMDSGALWQDFKLGMENLSRWERVAVVTDVEWIRASMRVFRFFIAGEAKLFDTAQAEEARRWIKADLAST